MKDESGTIDFIKDALKNDESGNLRNQMNLVKNTFLTHRQAVSVRFIINFFRFSTLLVQILQHFLFQQVLLKI